MKKIISLIILCGALVANAAETNITQQLATNAAVNTAVSNVIAQVTQEQIQHI